jgi:hypothetical protein
MTKKAKPPLEALFENDDLDQAVINADATGLLAEQHEIVDEEVEAGLEGKDPPREPPA